MHDRLRHAIVPLTVLALSGVSTGGQSPRALSLDAIYDPAARVDFSGPPAPNVTWIDDTSYATVRRSGSGVEWQRVDAVSGRASALFEAGRMEAAIAALPGVGRERARTAARSADLTFNPARSAVLFDLSDDLYVYDITTNVATRLTQEAGAELEPAFSPDGRRVAFVRHNNLVVTDVAATPRERRLTSDGGPQILNGRLDWLYQEEIYGRGRFRAFWWSPDSSAVAFLRLDERPVPEYTVVDHLPYRPTLEVTDYPKAGDPNPLVSLGVARVEDGTVTWVDQARYAKDEILIVNVGWTPDSASVVHQVQNREQTWLDLNLADPRSGSARTLLRETTPAWVGENGNPVWLRDGSFLWLRERSGFKHIYHVEANGRDRRQVTEGRWEVRRFHGVDEAAGLAYFSAGARDHLSTDVFSIRLDGTAMTRLSQGDGTHSASFSPSFGLYIDEWSTLTAPAQMRLHDRSGREVRVVHADAGQALREFRLVTPEVLQIKARDGFVLDAMMLKPPDFSPSRQYPVYQFVYGGPGLAQVRNEWGGTQYLFHQLLAQSGVIVWVLDNRSAGGRGAESQWPIYGRLGELELRDLEDGVAWLKGQPYIDASRMVLSGWSYGGFMAAYAMTHSTSWSAGIVGAAVTDWRDYDTIYTERYMKTPQNNAEGYRRTAPRFAAERLQGRLLLLHGMMDDNVHVQNSIQFAYELQRAGKPFEMMLYPRSRHGVSDPRQNLHLRRLMFDFVMRATKEG